MHDDFEPISAIVERLVEGVARPGAKLVRADRGGRDRGHAGARHSDLAAGTELGTPDPGEETEPGAAQAGTGVARRAHTTPSEGVGGDVVIWISFGKVGAAVPTPPPRHSFRDHRTPDDSAKAVVLDIPPATGRLGFRLRR